MTARAPVPDDAGARRDQIAHGLDQVHERMAGAAAAAGRDPGELTLVVVTKTYPPSDVALLASLGVQDVGENRDQEAAPKHEACAALGLRWHFIGQLQSNKARSIAGYVDLVHSVDRPSLVRALAAAAARRDRVLDCLVQASLDGDPRRGGVPIPDLPALAEAVAASEHLQLRGVMAVAPQGTDPLRAFAVLPDLLETVREHAPQANVISAGMSEDLEAAVTSGATHLRVGSAILGPRRTLR